MEWELRIVIDSYIYQIIKIIIKLLNFFGFGT